MTQPSEKNRALARHWREVLGRGGQTTVHAYYNEDETLSVAILATVDAPQRGLTTFATVGLSDSTNEVAPGHLIPTELIAVGPSTSDLPARVIATVAFDHMLPGLLLQPGAPVPDAVSRNHPGAGLPHVLLWDPFLWEGLGRVEIDGELLFPLLAIPIAEGELRYAERHQVDALSVRFEQEQIDIFDWNRAAIT